LGYIIVIEGTDGCGKQTQTERLYNRLISDGYNVLRQSFPHYESPSSAPVKMYLGGEFGDTDKCLDAYQASTLFAVDRLCTYNKSLKTFYEKGGIIIFDRYVPSNMIHQAGKIDDETEINKYLDWLDDLEYSTLKLPRPNKVLFLDVPVEVSIKLAHERAELKAGVKKDIHENNSEHLSNAYKSGKFVANKYNWDIINCVENSNLRSIDEIHEDIYNIIKNDLK